MGFRSARKPERGEANFTRQGQKLWGGKVIRVQHPTFHQGHVFQGTNIPDIQVIPFVINMEFKGFKLLGTIAEVGSAQVLGLWA